MIVLAGLPRSGNNLIRQHILRCVRAVRPCTHVQVVIWHGTQPHPTWELPLRFVIPVRNPCFRELSVKRARLPDDWPEDECRANVFGLIGRYRWPVKLVSYEALVEDPEAVGRDLIYWLGLPWVPFPTEGNYEGRPELGPLFDGNAKYRSDP